MMQQPALALRSWLTALCVYQLAFSWLACLKPHHPLRPMCLLRKNGTGWTSNGDISIISTIWKKHFGLFDLRSWAQHKESFLEWPYYHSSSVFVLSTQLCNPTRSLVLCEHLSFVSERPVVEGSTVRPLDTHKTITCSSKEIPYRHCFLIKLSLHDTQLG